MNFLAHLHLAEPTPESRLGNLLGDFVKGLPWDERFSEPVWQGIMEHRYLDAFTDRHPAWKRSRARLLEENRRYAGIIIDLFYDFFLIRNWEKFCPETPVEEFVAELHRDLQSVTDQVPPELVPLFDRLIGEQWLLNYGNRDGIKNTLSRVAAASPNLAKLRGMEIELERNERDLELDFLEFYPDAIARSEVVRGKLKLERKIFVTN